MLFPPSHEAVLFSSPTVPFPWLRFCPSSPASLSSRQIGDIQQTKYCINLFRGILLSASVKQLPKCSQTPQLLACFLGHWLHFVGDEGPEPGEVCDKPKPAQSQLAKSKAYLHSLCSSQYFSPLLKCFEGDKMRQKTNRQLRKLATLSQPLHERTWGCPFKLCLEPGSAGEEGWMGTMGPEESTALSVWEGENVYEW